MDTGQKTESLFQLVTDIEKEAVVLPEFQRDFVWDIEKTFDLFDSFIRDIFVGSLIYGVPCFEISVRELDKRPRSGKGSRAKLAITSYQKAEIDKLVKTKGFRLLLDGQQRATSMYRALKGVDDIYFVVTPDAELPKDVLDLPPSKRNLEQVLSEFRSDPKPGAISISLHHIYRVLCGDASREKEKGELYLHSNPSIGLDLDAAIATPEFETYLTQAKNLENLLRQEKLVSYYLLDTDEEKFSLFFERSNSKGIQLNFIDILAAKLYAGFNLRTEIEKFIDENPALGFNREVVVRSICYAVSGGKDTGRAYILAKLTHTHFTEHWPTFTKLYIRAYEYLKVNHLLIHPAWMPYENMLIPLISFLRHIPHYDFAQISEFQGRIIRTWFWLSILSRRYSSAAQTAVLEDAQILERAAQNDFSHILSLFSKMQPQIRAPEDLYTVYKKYDAVYKGILNLIHYSCGGLVSLQSGDKMTWDSQLEDHHIFPKDYLSKHIKNNDIDLFVAGDCVVNRTLIPKLTNIKASNKAPSVYLAEIQKQNPKLKLALEKHLIPSELADAAYDDLYDIYLEDRAKQILGAIETHVYEAQESIVKQLKEEKAKE